MRREKLILQICVIIIFCSLIIIFIKLPYIFLKEKTEVNKNYSFTQEGIRQALKIVKDPEIDINIIDLGLVRDIQINKNNVKITVIFTSPYCPLIQYIIKQIEGIIKDNFEVEEVVVYTNETTLWTIDMMTKEGKKRLKAYLE